MLRSRAKHYLTICGLHKGETRNLREWLDYHLLVGVEHFYLVCNDDDPRPTEWLLREYEGKVTHIHIPGRPRDPLGIQGVAHRCLLEIAESRWCAVIDADEFLFPSGSDVRTVIERFEHYPAVGVHWKCFGSAGNLLPPQSVLRDVNRRPPLSFEANSHIKCIVDPRKIVYYRNSHLPSFVPGEFAVNAHMTPVKSETPKPIIHEPLCLHHYLIRSRVHLQERFARGKSDGSRRDNLALVARYVEQFDRNDESDDEIWSRFGASLNADRWH